MGHGQKVQGMGRKSQIQCKCITFRNHILVNERIKTLFVNNLEQAIEQVAAWNRAGAESQNVLGDTLYYVYSIIPESLTQFAGDCRKEYILHYPTGAASLVFDNL